MSTDPAPIYVLFSEGEDQPVPGQLNIVDVIPGDAGYNDFWRVVRVTVPSDYVANTATSLTEIEAADYPMEMTTTLVNCPIVPDGSTAAEGAGADGLTQGWYRGEVVVGVRVAAMFGAVAAPAKRRAAMGGIALVDECPDARIAERDLDASGRAHPR